MFDFSYLQPKIDSHLYTPYFPQIVSSLEYFPPLNSFRILVRKLFKFSLHKGKIIVTTIFYISRIQKRTVFEENICETAVKGYLTSKRVRMIFLTYLAIPAIVGGVVVAAGLCQCCGAR